MEPDYRGNSSLRDLLSTQITGILLVEALGKQRKNRNICQEGYLLLEEEGQLKKV